jgi:hypothetical protein
MIKFTPGIHIIDLEAAINYWRHRNPSSRQSAWSECAPLAGIYARAWRWRITTPPTRRICEEALNAWHAW